MTASKRLAFIDLLRGWAVIVMIETHMTNATIIPELRSTGLFDVINFINGLVAPSFLFASGMAYAVTTRRKIASYLSFGTPLFKQLGRLLFVLLVGYGLHLPRFNWHKILYEVEPEEWLMFWQADVLQCIAVSLLALQVMLLVLRTEKRLYRTAAGIALVIIAVTPLMWSYDFLNVLPAPIAAYLNGVHHSLFPIFPWMAFVFAGAIAGHLFAEGRARAGEAGVEAFSVTAQKRFLFAGLAFIVAAFVVMPLGNVIPVYARWSICPGFGFLRIGIVLVLCALMYGYETRHGVGAASPVALVGKESLLVYTVHLLLIYGKFSGFNYRRWVNHTHGFGDIALWTFGLIVAMYFLALVWDRIKQQGELWRRDTMAVTFIILALVFVYGPGE
jgi:uncharacterized membrane protein